MKRKYLTRTQTRSLDALILEKGCLTIHNMYDAVFYLIIFDGKHMFSVISCSNSNFWENGINSYLYFLADKNFYLLAVGDFHKTVDFALGKLLADQNYGSNRLPIESKTNICVYIDPSNQSNKTRARILKHFTYLAITSEESTS